MKKLAYLFPAVIAFGLAGCDDATGTADTDAETEDGTTDATDPTVDPTLDPTEPGTTGSSTTTDPTIDPDTGSESGTTEGPVGCTPQDECTPDTVEADCGANFVCIGCLCLEDGEPPTCPDGWGDGEYADCAGGEACGRTDLESACIGGPNASSVCLFIGCEVACDCPAAPEGFEDLVTCEDLFGPGGVLDGDNDCFLDCREGDACPGGMFCDGTVCVAGDDTPPPAPEVGFDDCVNNPGGVCLEGEICVSDEAGAVATAVCAQTGCTDPTTDCRVVPPGGDALAACAEIDDTSAGEECVVDCSGAETCPTGMVCAAAGYCSWEDAGFALSEDFLPGVLPGGWLAIDVDGLPVAEQVAFITAAWTVTDAFAKGDPGAYSTSFYDPAGSSDDWLVTPAVALSATSVLSWDGRAQDMNFPDGYEVYVVDATDLDLIDFVTSSDPTAFLAANDAILIVAAETPTVSTRTLSAAAGEPLEALVGSDVHVFWRNNSNDDFVLIIDNVSITN